MKKTKLLWIVIICLILALIGVTSHLMTLKTNGFIVPPIELTKATDSPKAFSDGLVHSFTTEDELLTFMQSVNNNYYRGGTMEMDMAIEASAAPQSASVKSSASANDFSTTNVQVEGVDEGDLLKTDGEYIYTITDNTLYIIKVDPAQESEVVYKKQFSNRPSGLLLIADKLVVYGSLDWKIARQIVPRGSMSFVEVYDVSDKADISLENDMKFEGYITESRETNGILYFVSQSNADFSDDYPTPIIMSEGVTRSIAIDDIYYIGIPYSPNQYTTVHKIELDSFDLDEVSIVTNYGTTVYMSPEQMYVATSVNVNEYEIQQDLTISVLEQYLTSEDKEKIDRINAVPFDILSKQEKERKIQQVYEQVAYRFNESEQKELEETIENMLVEKLDSYEYFSHTHIQRINLDDMSVAANNKVPGRLNNQFSLDEFEDTLRVATTVDERWSRMGKEQTKSENHVYTLDMDLNQLDSITGLAVDEQIYATRFIGERLYAVTFRQIDPFFVIDLADPTDISVLGELKIPGFSRYLHPYDENTIIGIGQDADEKTGRAQGLKISLFDVTDVTNPIETANFVTDEKYAQSQALYEHKAFLFNKERNLLVIPAYSPNYYWDEGQKDSQSYNGAFVFNITAKDIVLRGLIDHSGDTQNYWQPQVERSLYIGDNLFTKSPNLLRVNALDTLESVVNVTLTPVMDEGIIEIY